MSDVSAIEWTDSTWNVVTGCTRVSPGCAHCYIERTPPFRMAGRRFEHDGDGSTTGLILHPERLERVPKGPRVFVNSLSDLFHERFLQGEDWKFVARTFAVMSIHTDRVFQVLTKRPQIAHGLLVWPLFWLEVNAERLQRGYSVLPGAIGEWPLPNVWLGMSIENARFTWRADWLRETPAAVRFISAEPLLGSLFQAPSASQEESPGAARRLARPASGSEGSSRTDGTAPRGVASLDLTGIDWVIVGGESGPGARPMHPDWARELRDACRAQGPEGMHGWKDANTAFFFKQWGEWAPGEADYSGSSLTGNRRTTRPGIFLDRNGKERSTNELSTFHLPDDWARMARFGKKKAGRELDGRTWDEMPAAYADRATT